MSDDIDKLGMMVTAIGECCLCNNESADVYTVRFVDKHGNEFIMKWRVCDTCITTAGGCQMICF